MFFMELLKNSSRKIIGRQKELNKLHVAYNSRNPAFVAVYGRRRVGKSFLIQKFMQQKIQENECTIFWFSGIKMETSKNQLSRFYAEICKTFNQTNDLNKKCDVWFKMYDVLNQQIVHYLNQRPNHKLLIVLDELQWLEKPSSGFLASLAYIWNSYWFMNPRLKLVVCGSSASFIKKKILWNRGDFYGRVTMKIEVKPFSLNETREYFSANDFDYTNQEIAELYMCLGGIPYYFDQFEKTHTVHENIHAIFYSQDAYLPNEIDALLASLSKKSDRYFKLIDSIDQQTYGVSLKLLRQKFKGKSLYPYLKELIACGFIEKISQLNDRRQAFYRLVDPFLRFYLQWMRNDFMKTNLTWDQIACHDQNFRKWLGYQFELLCWLHRSQIRSALNIQVGLYDSFRWTPKPSTPPHQSVAQGVEIDLLFIRADGVVQIFEIKHCAQPFAINKSYADHLKRKLQGFESQGVPRVRALFRRQPNQKIRYGRCCFTLIASSGVTQNQYSKKWVHSSLSLDDLFCSQNRLQL